MPHDVMLGRLIDCEQQRDAVHVAVAPVVAGEALEPGQRIGFQENSTTTVYRAIRTNKGIGIVDPFLEDIIQPGDRFWMFLYPQTITSLRHDWTHPDFPSQAGAASDKAKSEEWLREFCKTNDAPDYETLLAGAVHCDDDEYLHFNNVDAHGEIPSEFWEHVEVVTGEKIPVRAKYFSCSC